MAIKEFQVGPLNYFESGYFDGDYTLPNVSKSFLECDIDNIKGGRVVTGLYYLDNYIDGTYYHDNSIRAFMTVEAMVVQEATIDLQGYINDSYYQAGYYQTRGSIFTLIADIEAVGQTVEASGTITSQFTQSISVGRIRQAQSEVNASFTQTALVEKLKEINLFAFSEAAIQVAIEVTRQANIDLATQFDIATDVSRLRDLDADSDSEFDFDLVNQRSRDFNIETETAFLLATDNDRIRYYTSSQTASSALACTISHIEGADIVALGFATLSATIDDRLRDQSAALTSQFTATTVNSRIRFPQASLIANSFQTTDPRRVRFGVLNANIISTVSASVEKYKGVGIILLSGVMSSSLTAKVNDQAPPANGIYSQLPQRKTIDVTSTYTYNRSVGTGVIRKAFNFFGGTSALAVGQGIYNIEAEANFATGLLSNNSAIGIVRAIVYIYGNDGGQSDWYDEYEYVWNLGVVETVFAPNNDPVVNTVRIKLVFDATPSDYLTVYLDGSSTPHNIVSVSSEFKNRSFTLVTNQIFPGKPYPGDGLLGWPTPVFPQTNYIGYQSTSVVDRTFSNESYTLYYLEQDYATADLVSNNFASLTASALVVQLGQANIAGTSSLSATSLRIKQSLVSLNSDFQRLFIVTKVVEGATSISAATSLTALNTLVRLAQSAMLANFAQSATALRTRTSTAELSAVTTTFNEGAVVGSARTDLTATSTMSVQNDRIRFGQPQLDSIATTLAVVFRNATGTVTLESNTALSVDAVKTSDQPQQMSAEFTATVDGLRSRDNSSDASSQFDLSIVADRRKAAGSEMIAESNITINTDLSLTRTTTANLQALGAVLSATEDSLTRTSSADLTASTQLICINDRFKIVEATMSSVASIQLFTTRVVRITAELVSQGFVLSDNDVLNIDPYRQLKVPQETRFEPVTAESRVSSVDSETRVNNLI